MGAMNQQVGQATANALGAMTQVQEMMLDEEINRLDALGEDDFAKLRGQRLAEMKKRKEEEAGWAKTGHGTYAELSETKEFFSACKASKRVAVHFYRPTSRYCEIIDGMMAKLASLHHETRFLKMAAEKTPYLCEKMLADPDGNVVIPTVLLVNEGKVVYHIRGLEEIGGEEASPAALGLILALHGIIEAEAADDEYNNTEAAPIDMEEYRAKAIREGGFGSIDSDDDFEDDGGTIDAHDA